MLKPAALRAFQETFTVKVPQQNAEISRRMLVQTAERVRDATIGEQRSRAGVAPDYVQIVDRKRGAPLTDVRPDGVIVFEWIYLNEIAQVAVDMLLARGPQQSGDWKKSISVFVDDVKVAADRIPKTAQLIEVAPLIIYARRLEIGRDRKGGPFVVNAPPHLVQETALMLAAQYRRVATIKHSYVQLQGDVSGLRGRARNKAQADMRYPCIQIRPLPA